MTETYLRSKRKNFFLIIMLGVLNANTPFSIDMYLPGFPEIAEDLHTDIAKVSFSVSAYFLGYAIGQIIYGPLLDRFGRKPPLYAGLILYIFASVACMSLKNHRSTAHFSVYTSAGRLRSLSCSHCHGS